MSQLDKKLRANYTLIRNCGGCKNSVQGIMSNKYRCSELQCDVSKTGICDLFKAKE